MLKNGIEVISCDLLDKEKLYTLPEVDNIIYMAGKKFGTNGNEWQTWGMNSVLPTFVADKFKKSNIVVFSSAIFILLYHSLPAVVPRKTMWALTVNML